MHTSSAASGLFTGGAGVPEDFIIYMRSSAFKSAESPSCFISYSSKDDDFASRLVLQEFLKHYGTIHIAVNGKEAVDAAHASLAAAEPYNLICMDIAKDTRDSFGYYAVRYWLTDLPNDDPTSSRVRERIFTALRRAGIPMARAAQTLFVAPNEAETDRSKRHEQQRLTAEASLSEEIRRLESQKTAAKETEYQLKLKELEKQLEDQKKLAVEMERRAEEMQRKAEQGSMQLQGEVQELALEELLRAAFPFDTVSEVGKGIRGADCIQIIRNSFGQECGTIIYESKRTQTFSADWIEKLKADMRSHGAAAAVIVTHAMPKDMDRFGERNGVYICSFAEVKALANILRNGIIQIFNAGKSQENKGDKMQLLYDYLISGEFAEQWKAIRRGFHSMRQSIQRERETMERLWKAREKQLEKVLLNAAHIRGSIEGIAGKDAIDINLLEDGSDELP